MLVVRVKSPDGQMTYEGALLNLEKQYVLFLYTCFLTRFYWYLL